MMNLKRKGLILLLLLIILSILCINLPNNSSKTKIGDLSPPESCNLHSTDLESLWNITWGGGADDWASGIAIDKITQSIYCVGGTYSFGPGIPAPNLYLVKFYENGTRAWNVTWGGLDSDYGSRVTIDDASSDIYCLGSTSSFGLGNSDFALVKFFSNGTVAWNVTWGGISQDEGIDLSLNPTTGDIYCIGHTLSYGAGNYDWAICKFYSNGTLAWNVTWGGIDQDLGFGVKVDSMGAIFCTGNTWSSGAGNADLALVKFYSNGTQAWNTTWGGVGSDMGKDLKIDSKGDIYCLGQTSSFGSGNNDFALIKFYSNGTRVWNTTWGGANVEEAYSMASDNSEAMYCIGQTNSFGAGDYDFALIKFYSNGTRMWNTTWDGGYDEFGSDLAIDLMGSVYCAGTIVMGGTNLDLALVKYTGYPDPPVLLQVIPNPTFNGSVILNWSNEVSADLYYIYRETSFISSLEGLSPIALTSSNIYEDTMVTPDIYYYAIVAENGMGRSMSNCESVEFTQQLFNASTFYELASYSLNQSDYEMVRDMEAFDFLNWNRKQIILISSIWNTSQYHRGLIQVFDYDLKYYNQITLLDTITLADGSGNLDLFDIQIYDIDKDNITEILISGGVSNEWAFLKVYNLTDGKLNFEWDTWWDCFYKFGGGVAESAVVFADFDNDTTVEICTLTSTSYSWEDYQNVIRFWTYANKTLTLENTFDFGTNYLELGASIDDSVNVVDYDTDNRTELLIFGGHGSSGNDDCANLYALNYNGTALTTEASRSWPISIYGTSLHGTSVGDFDADGELEILAKMEFRTSSNVPQSHYKMLNYSNSQFKEEFIKTYTPLTSLAHLPGNWLPRNFNSEPSYEFISSDYYSANYTAFLRVWDYIGSQLKNSETMALTTNCTFQPPLLRFLNDGFPLFVCYPQRDVVGYNLRIRIYGQPDNLPPLTNAPSGAVFPANASSSYNSWILTDNYRGGDYQVWLNGSLYRDWTRWISGHNLSIPVKTDHGLGIWNYTLLYNDSVGLWGTPATVFLSITDQTPPNLMNLGDLEFEQGLTGQQLIWNVTDITPANYTIYKNGGVEIQGNWTSGTIKFDLVNLSSGSYSYTLIVEDSVGYTVNDTVIVTVHPSHAPEWVLNPLPPEGLWYAVRPVLNLTFTDFTTLDNGWFALDSQPAGAPNLFIHWYAPVWTNSSWQLPLSSWGSLADGPHTLYLMVNDSLGNVEGEQMEWAWSFYKDTNQDSDGDGLNDTAEFVLYLTNPYNADTDGDGLNDSAELFIYHINATNWDIDSDGLSDGEELLIYGTNVTNPDTDCDGLNDSSEVFLYFTNPKSLDTDGDGLNDPLELFFYYTNASNSDTDGDRLRDDMEIHYFLTNATNPDTDSDGAWDGDEIELYQTDPLNPDMDGDLMLDGWEITYQLNPKWAGDASLDIDMDGLTNCIEHDLKTNPNDWDSDDDLIPDGWEVNNYLNPLNTTDAQADFDNDTLTNRAEYYLKTDPYSKDSDGDLMPDGWEVDNALSPMNPADKSLDIDADGLTNIQEYNYRTDPRDYDSDNDGFSDGAEITAGTNPLDEHSVPASQGKTEDYFLEISIIVVGIAISAALIVNGILRRPKIEVQKGSPKNGIGRGYSPIITRCRGEFVNRGHSPRDFGRYHLKFWNFVGV